MALDAKRLVEAAVDNEILLPGSPRVERDDSKSPAASSIRFESDDDNETHTATNWEQFRRGGGTIESKLGVYERDWKLDKEKNERWDRIRLFYKGIQSCAEWIQVHADALLEVVRIHEWAHALLHRGVDLYWVTEWRADPMRINKDEVNKHRWELEKAMQCWAGHDRDHTVEEHLSQLITYRVIEDIREWPKELRQELEEDLVGLDQLDGAFRALMEKQSAAYDIRPLVLGPVQWTAAVILEHVRLARLEPGLTWAELVARVNVPAAQWTGRYGGLKLETRDWLCEGSSDWQPHDLLPLLSGSGCDGDLAQYLLELALSGQIDDV
jgi:hypothetical protein